MKRFINLSLALLLILSLAACNSDDKSTSSNSPSTPSSKKATATLYAVMTENDIKEKEFTVESGEFTPEKAAQALSDWTGLKFTVTSEKTDTGAFVVEWSAISSFGTGDPPDSTSEFQFSDSETLRWFMLNSLCRTIRENLGKVDVYYNFAGDDAGDFDLGPVFNPSVPYNKANDARVIV